MRAKPLLSLEEYERLPDDGNRYELDEGELVLVTHPSYWHSQIQHRIRDLLSAYLASRSAGAAYVEVAYVLSQNLAILRTPDVSVLSQSRLSQTPRGKWVDRAPELAIEILSPSNRPKEVRRKVAQYLAAGALAVWVVNPEKEQVQVHERGKPGRVLQAVDTIEGNGPLAGFSTPVRSFFEL